MGWAPYDGPARIRRLAVVGLLCTLLMLVLGSFLVADGESPLVLVLGIVFAVLWPCVIALARKRGKL
jgi:hypothetical protein